MVKKRLDKYLVDNNFIESRNKAQREIKAGNILIDNKVCKKKSFKVDESFNIQIKDRMLKYVSIAGLKLKYFIENLDINIKNFLVLDVGSSTGGFAEVLLEKGARKIYAVDVGKNQLHKRLKKNNKVEVYENTDIRDFAANNKIEFDLITVDVSFISIKKVLKNIIDRSEKFILLFKPQFESQKREKNKKGVLTDLKKHIKLLREFVGYLEFNDLNIVEMKRSKILGQSGNREYLFYCDKNKDFSFNKNNIKKEVYKDESLFINKSK